MSNNCDANFKKEILRSCYLALEEEGFTRFDEFNVDWPFDENFHCWVGINSALYPDRVELTPNVGVHVVSIQKLICSLDNGPYARQYNRGVATYALNIGKISGAKKERAFAFNAQQSDTFIKSECARLAKIFSTFGLDYAKSIASYNALKPLLKQHVNSLGEYPERYASCLHFLGLDNEAKEFLTNFPEQYREFIQGFSEPFIESIS